ncbi:Protein fam78b [Saguinus oedipus]|uniref:Protein fam78b n=1 Tax=Saguinus oedipus TaxID=9490 RepID=A0ABQ9UZC3_SAGOE|nr:Protein fam78b [Saguinus oedipus]
MSSWELPDLREGRVKAIGDSDGVSYPWYGNTTETVTLVGPTNKISRFSVSMNDNFYPSVTWAVPWAWLVGRTQQEQPQILSWMEPNPPNALVKPNANNAQVLMWRPNRGPPLVVIPPK